MARAEKQMSQRCKFRKGIIAGTIYPRLVCHQMSLLFMKGEIGR